MGPLCAPPHSRDNPMEGIEITGHIDRGKTKVPVPCMRVSSIDLTRSVHEVKLQEILVAVGAKALPPLSRESGLLANMDPNVAIQRLVWTPVGKWDGLKKLSKHNAGLRVAFSKANAALLCNFVIKTRYPDEAAYLGLDLSDPLSSQWLIPKGPQVLTISNCEQKFWLQIMEELNLEGIEHLYETGISFLEPGPALLFGLESGMVMVIKDPGSGRMAGALREDVARKCLEMLTSPWLVRPNGYGRSVPPRSESGAITWYYDQEGGREDAVEALDEILASAETREALNFEDVK